MGFAENEFERVRTESEMIVKMSVWRSAQCILRRKRRVFTLKMHERISLGDFFNIYSSSLKRYGRQQERSNKNWVVMECMNEFQPHHGI